MSLPIRLCRASLALVISVLPVVAVSQTPETQGITLHSTSSLVLVDVIAQDPKHGVAQNQLQQQDFEVRDNGNPAPIVAFDDRTSYGTRPVALWFVVICSEGNNPDGSEKFIGKESSFRPALDSLGSYDRVGVAHWCDNGEAEVDLSPSGDRDAAITALAHALKPILWTAPAPQYRRLGELAFQWMLELLIEQAHATEPEALPVIVCLYGDHSGQPIPELEQLLDYLLSTSGFVYGIKDRSTSDFSAHISGNRPQVLHYLAEQTGGEYFAEKAKGYADALREIVEQVHSRYGLGIHPIKDGKRHHLTVELTPAARQRYKAVKLRYRAGYTTNFPINVLADPLNVALDEQAPIPRRLTFEAKVSNQAEPASGASAAHSYTVDYAIPEPQLKFARGADGSQVYSVEFAVAVYDKDGRKLDDVRRNMSFTVARDHIAEVRQSGFHVRGSIEVRGGATLLRFIARDQLGGDIGTVNVTLPLAKVAQ